ncbi:hypothetical protein ElyMa_006068200 [Elysia marginata]|uniref:Uncharacterized protein n=1 Tax=Elysia marginata TaxID=1093978 RepID=A0AAV4GNM4_9GAST|nr:hypothetical protein ElyMa_006068200 [Elysia marginata]
MTASFHVISVTLSELDIAKDETKDITGQYKTEDNEVGFEPAALAGAYRLTRQGHAYTRSQRVSALFLSKLTA